MAEFRGSCAVMVTPFDAAGRLDEATVRRFLDWQVSEGVRGLIPLGSTDELLSKPLYWFLLVTSSFSCLWFLWVILWNSRPLAP